jgi:dTDP-4-amino-4,6-dideoxygalactose transaminase
VTTPYSFFATASSARRLGAEVAFVDIEPASFNLDPDRLEDFLAHDPRAARARLLVPVHLYGRMADMPRLMALAAGHGLAVIEDAAQAVGSSLGGRAACAWGRAGTLSFFPSKNLGGPGDGGMVLTADAELAARLKALRHHGERGDGQDRLLGGNFRLDELQAAVLLVKLLHLDTWTEARRGNAVRYVDLLRKAGLAPDLVTLPEGGPGRHVYNQFVIRVPRRDALRAALAHEGIDTAVYYPRPLHLEPCLVGAAASFCPEAERAARESLALPISPELEVQDQERVVAVLARFLTP